MKNIFIVTDFSAASRNAAVYGIQLAKYFGSKVFLFHAYQAPVQVPESYIFYATEDVWSNVKELLEKEAAAIDPGKTVEVEICGSEGATAKAIVASAESYHADLIICGMKATVKGLRRIFGSTTTALSRLSAIPILIVPEEAGFRKPARIALASDMDSHTSPDTVGLLRELGEKFHARLSVVWVVDEGTDEKYKMRLQPAPVVENLKDMNPEYEFPKGRNIALTLETYSDEHEVDIMAVIPHKHGFLDRFFIESTTTHLIFHTHVPLLVLPQKLAAEEQGDL